MLHVLHRVSTTTNHETSPAEHHLLSCRGEYADRFIVHYRQFCICYHQFEVIHASFSLPSQATITNATWTIKADIPCDRTDKETYDENADETECNIDGKLCEKVTTRLTMMKNKPCNISSICPICLLRIYVHKVATQLHDSRQIIDNKRLK